MPFKVVEIQLTDEQLARLVSEVSDLPYALLAQPRISGRQGGVMSVYFCTPEQHALINKGTMEARKLPEYGKPREV